MIAEMKAASLEKEEEEGEDTPNEREKSGFRK